MLPLFIAMLAAGLGVVVYTILTNVEEKSVVRSSLRQLEGYEVENVRDQELLVPLRDRALIPFLNGLTGLGQRFTPVGYVDGIRQKFVYAGKGNADTVERFLAIRVATVAMIPVAFILAFFVLPLSGIMPLATFGLFGIALVLGPDAILNRKVEARQHEMQVKLPDILDLLT